MDRLRGAGAGALAVDTPRRHGTFWRWLPAILLALALIVGLSGGAWTQSAADTPAGVSSPPPSGDVIVVLKDRQTDPRAVAGNDHVNPRHVYRHAINGFAAHVSERQAQALARNPRVASISADRPVEAFAQTLPTGVDRIDADTNPTAAIDGIDTPVDADVAVLDTGIDPNHPDLNVAGGVDCTNSGSYADNHGHGTHVAGIIGALDNGIGVVGVAPGVRLWAVKVLNSSGSGTQSMLICGLDWVVANAGTIDVVNMSLGGTGSDGSCTSSAYHRAICNTVNAGVTVVVAAGNESTDASSVVPATYAEVITVSAFTDFNGKPGGGAPVSCTSGGVDDTFASYSNYGADVDIAAPGTCIRSTYPGGGTALMTGTSMASPHVAGAAALYKATNPGASPDAVRSWLLSMAKAQSSTFGFSGDPDGIAEPVLYVGSGAPVAPTATATGTSTPRPTVTATATATPTRTPTATPSATATGTATASATPVPTATFTPVPTATATSTATATATATRVPPTSTPRPTATATATATPTATAVPSLVPAAPTAIATATATATNTPRPTATRTPTPRPTATATRTPIPIPPTATATATVTPLPTATPTPTSTATSTPRPTATSVPATATPAPTSTSTPAPSPTVTPMRTPTPVPTANVLPASKPSLGLSSTRGTVNSRITVMVSGFPRNATMAVQWDGVTEQTVTTSSTGTAQASFRVPAAVIGTHTVRAVSGSTNSSVSYTLVPRIKLMPASASPGEVVNISLRGYAKHESVRIRWLRGSSWITLKTVTTSSTGSANVYLPVPSWVSEGPQKVRGDGTVGRAQTNAFTVTGTTVSAAEATETAPGISPAPTPATAATSLPPAQATPYPIVASDQTDNSTNAQLVIDGDPSTYWVTTTDIPPTGAYIQLDLGMVQPIGAIRWLFAQTGMADGLSIRASEDGENWATMADPGNADPGVWQELNASVAARYIRFAFNNPTHSAILGGLAEVEIWPTDAPVAPLEIAPTPTVEEPPPEASPVGDG